MRLPSIPSLSNRPARSGPADSLHALGAVVQAGLRQLPAELQNIVVLADMEGCSQAEIARRLKLDLSEVRAGLSQGRLYVRSTKEGACFDLTGAN